MTGVLAVIDGEHYAPVVRDTLASVGAVAAWLAGGTEKLRGGEDYGVPLVESLEEGIERFEPEVVMDLSDEPVLGPAERFRVASRVLARGLSYVGPDFRIDPPFLAPFELPSFSLIGTGKRVGKTAVSGHIARLLARRRNVVVVAMGRGGPATPEVADRAPTVDDLLRLSREGKHAASDYLEDAALAGVVTVGCRRCGGGLAGMTTTSNVQEGAQVAARLEPDLVIFEGSGSALPPVATSRRILVAGAHQPPELVTGYLNAYRILISDLVVLTMAEEDGAHEQVRAAIRELAPALTVVAASLRPRPVEPIAGRRVAFFTTAQPAAAEPLGAHLREEHGADVVHVSTSLARRDELRRELESVDAEVYLVEIKAAAIDAVAETAAARGIPVVFADNEVRPLPGEPDLDAEVEALAEAAMSAGVPS